MKTIMYANLSAEQARKGMTDSETAKAIGICTRTYVAKKRNGTFKAGECKTLCKLFDSEFKYLFKTDKEA